MGENEGWVVLRIVRVRADDAVYPDADQAAAAAFSARTREPDTDFAVAHTSFPTGERVVEYAWSWIDPLPSDPSPILHWKDSIMNRWPQNDPAAGGKGPWGVEQINRKPVKVVRRIVTYSPWEDVPEPEGEFA